jgi:hypothetical protein
MDNSEHVRLMVDFEKMLRKSKAKSDIVALIIRAHEALLTNDELIDEIDRILEDLTRE